MKKYLVKYFSFFTLLFFSINSTIFAVEKVKSAESVALGFVNLVEPLELKTILNPSLPLSEIAYSNLEKIKPCSNTTVSDVIVFLWCGEQKFGKPDFQPFGLSNLRVQSKVIKTEKLMNSVKVVVQSNIFNKSNSRIIKSKNRIIELKLKNSIWKVFKQVVNFN